MLYTIRIVCYVRHGVELYTAVLSLFMASMDQWIQRPAVTLLPFSDGICGSMHDDMGRHALWSLYCHYSVQLY